MFRPSHRAPLITPYGRGKKEQKGQSWGVDNELGKSENKEKWVRTAKAEARNHSVIQTHKKKHVLMKFLGTLWDKIDKEVSLGRMADPFKKSHIESLVVSLLGVVPTLEKWKIQLMNFVRHMGKNAQLANIDIGSAFTPRGQEACL